MNHLLQKIMKNFEVGKFYKTKDGSKAQIYNIFNDDNGFTQID